MIALVNPSGAVAVPSAGQCQTQLTGAPPSAVRRAIKSFNVSVLAEFIDGAS
jgi:hypothetical protein